MVDWFRSASQHSLHLPGILLSPKCWPGEEPGLAALWGAEVGYSQPGKRPSALCREAG